MIDRLATEKGHQIAGRINIDNREELTQLNTAEVDVAIEFSQPGAAVENIKWCIDQGIPVAVGTTGWLDQKSEVDAYCKGKNGTYLYASNFSVGVNVFFKLNQFLARLMDRQPNYDISMKEIHHTQKLDAPSGTAITLAEGILKEVARKSQWAEGSTTDPKTLAIASERIDPTPGTHSIHYDSPVDAIEIKHTAHGREGFANGAIMVAEWLANQSGVLTMDDFLDL